MREREFPAGIDTEVVVEGRRVVLEVKKKDIEDFMPQVMIFSNGDVSSFEVILRRDQGEDRAPASIPTSPATSRCCNRVKSRKKDRRCARRVSHEIRAASHCWK